MGCIYYGEHLHLILALQRLHLIAAMNAADDAFIMRERPNDGREKGSLFPYL